MKKTFTSFISILILVCGAQFPFKLGQNLKSNTGSTISIIKDQYGSNFDYFYRELSKFTEFSEAYLDGNKSVDELQDQLIHTRLAYKKIEYLFDYLDPELSQKYFNGAPLPKLMKHVPEVTVIEPNGLQTLDELVFLSPETEKEEIAKLAQDLLKHALKAKNYQSNKVLQHRYVIEAMRYGIVRIYTLGLTGFDTPGSANGIQESISALLSMSFSFEHYKSISTERSDDKFESIKESMSQLVHYLIENDDFDKLDRLYVLTEFINPLYSELLDFQKSMNIELKFEADQTLYPHNYESKHIFDDDFFNPAYYTQIAESDLNDPAKIELGRTLFYDPALSRNLDMSCASCHNPKKGFTDGLPKSKTNKEDKFTDRHAPTLLNSSLYGRYFWDMREYDLERQIKHVVHNNLEFDMDFIELADRLKTSSEYAKLFKEAYGDRDKYGISTWSISNSLAAYVNSLTSYNSEFDKYARGESKEIDKKVRNGFNLFMGKAACGTCHFAPSFSGIVPPFYTDSESEVLGIIADFDTLNPMLDHDAGRYGNGIAEENAAHYLRSMKTVTVRNAEITAPYMHNGSLETLEEVMHFYNKGGGAGMGLDVPHQTLPDAHLNLDKSEISDLITFVESLTDTIGLNSVPVDFPKFEDRPEWNKRTTAY